MKMNGVKALIITLCLIITGISVLVEPTGIGDDLIGTVPTITQSTRLPQLNWTVTPDTSPSNLIYQKHIEIDINDDISGVKYYKVDKVTDITGTVVSSDDDYPKWFREKYYIIKFEDKWERTYLTHGPVYIRVSGWSDKEKNGGVQVTQNSSVEEIFYDHSFESLNWQFDWDIKGPGRLMLRAIPTDPDLGNMTKLWMWCRFKYTVQPSGNLKWNIDSSTAYPHYNIPEYTNVPEYLVTTMEPGIQYINLYGAINGLNPYQSTGGLYTGVYSKKPSNPLAIITPFSNSTIPEPHENFTGTSIIMPSIPGDLRVPIVKTECSIFSGGNIRFFTHDRIFQYREIEIPDYIKLWRDDYEDITSQVTDGSVPVGFRRYQRYRPNPPVERGLKYTFTFPDDKINNTFDFRVRIYNGAMNSSLLTNWATTKMKCIGIPNITQPKRLFTQFSWIPNKDFRRDGVDNLTAAVSIFKELGYNQFYPVGSSGDWASDLAKLDDWYELPDERNTDLWDDMKYGPLYNFFGGSNKWHQMVGGGISSASAHSRLAN